MKFFRLILSITCLVLTSCTAISTPGDIAPTRFVQPTQLMQNTVVPTPSPSAMVTSTVVIPVLETPTPDFYADDLEAYYDGLVITLDYVGKTVEIYKAQGILLRLGADYDWIVSFEPVSLITANRKITPEAGEQGVFIARERGKAVLSAIGTPKCSKQEPPCLRPSLLFTMTFDIK
jgi:hypothetical protein